MRDVAHYVQSSTSTCLFTCSRRYWGLWLLIWRLFEAEFGGAKTYSMKVFLTLTAVHSGSSWAVVEAMMRMGLRDSSGGRWCRPFSELLEFHDRFGAGRRWRKKLLRMHYKVHAPSLQPRSSNLVLSFSFSGV